MRWGREDYASAEKGRSTKKKEVQSLNRRHPAAFATGRREKRRAPRAPMVGTLETREKRGNVVGGKAGVGGKRKAGGDGGALICKKQKGRRKGTSASNNDGSSAYNWDKKRAKE